MAGARSCHSRPQHARSAAGTPLRLQAAAERERRLALSVALARQGVAAGLDPDEARARRLFGFSPAAQAEHEHMQQVTSALARQSEQMAAALQDNSEQLKRQQVCAATPTPAA